jgi:hypothetical protein
VIALLLTGAGAGIALPTVSRQTLHPTDTSARPAIFARRTEQLVLGLILTVPLGTHDLAAAAQGGQTQQHGRCISTPISVPTKLRWWQPRSLY